MNAFQLNDSQRHAAGHNKGPMMVLAGPGSGKTTVIICRVRQLIENYHIKPENILVITFSKAAAEQMRLRYQREDGGRSTGGRSTGETTVTFGTFHAIFFRILKSRCRYNVGQVMKEDERREAIKPMLSELGYAIEDELIASVLNELSLVKNELFDLRYYNSAAIGTEEFRLLFDRYESFKDDLGKIDFDDMLTLCHRLFSTEPEFLSFWRSKYTYILIDEFQDINHVQYECVKLLAAPDNNLFIVGDDDQSIYRFRGARPEFLLNFPNDYPAAQQVVLDINYRSTDPVIRLSNEVIKENRMRYGKRIVGTSRKGSPPITLTAEDQNHEAAVIASKIKAMHKKGADLNQIAVIYRVNIQARAFTDAFMHVNIPYQVKDEASVIYEHWIAKDLAAYLRLSQSRLIGYDPDAERIINKPYRYISKAFLISAKKTGANIFELYATDHTLQVQQRTRIEELLFYLQAIKTRETVNAIRSIRQTVGYDDYIRDYCRYRKLNPVGLFEIADELQEAAKQFPAIPEYLAHAEEAVLAAKQKNTRHEECVTLTTMHSAKGLEFETVFIAGAIEGVLPHERSRTEAELEEERRLFYVGVTRAKRELYISVLRTRYDQAVKPSRFIVKEGNDERRILVKKT